jgi:hypothetical protein
MEEGGRLTAQVLTSREARVNALSQMSRHGSACLCISQHLRFSGVLRYAANDALELRGKGTG